MSKLLEKIRKIGRADPAPMGFNAVAATDKPATLLIALRTGDPGKASGADIVILEDDSKAKDYGKAAGAIVGVTGDFTRDAIKDLHKAGADFIVVPDAGASAGALTEEKIGRVLTVSLDADDTTLRLIGDLSLDALLLAAPDLPLTVERFLAVRRVSAIAHTPLLVSVPADVDKVSLRLLRDSGAAAVVIEDAGKIKDLRERILELPARSKAKEEKREPLLPLQSAGDYDDDDDDDDWDD